MTTMVVPDGKMTDEQFGRMSRRFREIERRTNQGTIEYDQTMEALQRIIEGRFTPDPEIIIRVDRATRPAYPDWVKEALHPELELTGPSEYPLAEVELWLHDSQKNGGAIKGQVIYDYLKQNNLLDGCLGLADLVAIQKQGLEVFLRCFKGKIIFAWKSVVRVADGDLDAPYLYENGGRVVLDWSWLDNSWDADNPALRFAK